MHFKSREPTIARCLQAFDIMSKPLVSLNMNLSVLITERYDAFIALCRHYKVRRLYAFGSSITSHFDPQRSDIDLVVELDIQDPIDYGEALLSFWDGLENLFQRKVDLLTEDSIINPYLKKSVESTRKLIYDGQGEKVFV